MTKIAVLKCESLDYNKCFYRHAGFIDREIESVTTMVRSEQAGRPLVPSSIKAVVLDPGVGDRKYAVERHGYYYVDTGIDCIQPAIVVDSRTLESLELDKLGLYQDHFLDRA